jgi:hypothetical protein
MSSSTTLVAPRQHRLTRFAAVAALTVAAAGTAVVVTGDEQLLPEVRPFAQSTGAYGDVAANKAASMRALGGHLTARRAAPGPRYFDVEANRAASMRALGRHIAAQQAAPGPRYFDLEANKARSARAR